MVSGSNLGTSMGWEVPHGSGKGYGVVMNSGFSIRSALCVGRHFTGSKGIVVCRIRSS
jgi:hypothetical protein